MPARRERWTMLASVLRAIEAERVSAGEEARATNAAARAGVPYDRFQGYLTELRAAGLVEGAGRLPAVTQKGHEYLKQYNAWMENLARFGLD